MIMAFLMILVTMSFTGIALAFSQGMFNDTTSFLLSFPMTLFFGFFALVAGLFTYDVITKI